MKTKPLLIIPVETKVREFDAKLLLAVVALQRGFDVVLGALWELKFFTELLDRGIFLDKSIAKTKVKWFSRCRQQGHRVAALDEEGLVYFDAKTYRQLRIYSPSLEAADLFFAWGKNQAEVMSPVIDTLMKRIRLVGNSRFDLLRPELRKIYNKNVDGLRKKYGRFILFNTNFSFANSANNDASLLRAFSQCPIETEQPGFFAGWTEAQHKVLQSFQEVLPLVRERFPEHTIIIRPHPSEDLQFWHDAALSLKQTVVIREGNVVPWLLAADVLVHWNCTTAIEALLLGKPAIAYRKEQPDFYEQPLPNACSFHAASSDELLDMLDQAIAGRLTASPEQLAEQGKILAHHISSLQGSLAAEKMVEELLQLSQTFPRQRNISQRTVQVMKRLWRAVLDQLDRSRQIRDSYVAGKFPDTTADEVQKRVQVLSECLGYSMDITVREKCRNCFSLSAT